jgi:hypothetical protein
MLNKQYHNGASNIGIIFVSDFVVDSVENTFFNTGFPEYFHK